MSKEIVLTEEEQIEQTKQWLKSNLPSIVIGIGLGLALVFGYNFYQDTALKKAQQASALYEEIIKSEQALTLAAEKSSEFKEKYSRTPYAAKVALLAAKFQSENDKGDQALAELSWVIDNAKEELVKHTARLRKAGILISNEKLSEAKALLDDINANSLESHYAELNGDIALKQQQYNEAMTYYQSALDSSTDPRYNTYLHLKLNKATSFANSQ